MAAVRPLHCAQLWLIVTVAANQISREDMDDIVDLHNMYRASVKPEAADMTRMTWCEECRVVAELYASECVWEHNPNVKNVLGENLYITTGTLNVTDVLMGWFKEREHYDYENNQCAENEMCGHYTQMVWAKTASVGCAALLCDTVQGLSFTNSILVVCNYKPPGNVQGHKPYQAGEPCSKCPEDRRACVDMSCDHVDIVPSTETEHVDIVPSTETEQSRNPEDTSPPVLGFSSLWLV
ncbi:peptidase inhibitor 16 isoform X2 [Brachyhypopomus gauderio]|uniref:peptidase inhibitor 16 isoform X2 n=1 Tax=Brachyhypopomus gauderio TaxID=698409 RepID=UPI004041A226